MAFDVIGDLAEDAWDTATSLFDDEEDRPAEQAQSEYFGGPRTGTGMTERGMRIAEWGANPFEQGTDDYLSSVYQKDMRETGGASSAIDPTKYYVGGTPTSAADSAAGAQYLATLSSQRSAPVYDPYADPNMQGAQGGILRGWAAVPGQMDAAAGIGGQADRFGATTSAFQRDIQNPIADINALSNTLGRDTTQFRAGMNDPIQGMNALDTAYGRDVGQFRANMGQPVQDIQGLTGQFGGDVAAFRGDIGATRGDIENIRGGAAMTTADIGAIRGDVGQFRGDLQDIYRTAATGAAPSAAELAMRAQSERALRQNLAMAATAGRGANAASAFSQAAQQNAMQQGELSRDLGVQRAAEMAQARQQLLGAQQNILSGAGQITAGTQALTDRERAILEGQRVLTGQQGELRAGFTDQVGAAGLQADIAAQNMGVLTDAFGNRISAERQQADVAAQNMGILTDVAGQRIGAAGTQGDIMLGAQGAATDAFGRQIDAGATEADILATVRGQSLEGAQMQGDWGMETARTGAELQQQQQAQNDAMVQYFMSLGFDYTQAQTAANLQMEQNRQNEVLQNRAIEAGTFIQSQPGQSGFDKFVQTAGAFGGAAEGVGSLAGGKKTTSDVRAKQNIRPAEAETQDFYRKLAAFSDGPTPDARGVSASSWEYRDPAYGTGRRYSGMAQELERDPVMRSVVRPDENGVKRVDTGALTMTNTSAIGSQQRQLDETKSELEKTRSELDELRQIYARQSPDVLNRVDSRPARGSREDYTAAFALDNDARFAPGLAA